jgi:hypothetical protein
MSRLRRVASTLFLALAVLLGQHAAALHALGHATEELSRKQGAPAPNACDQCFACAQLSSGASPTLPTIPAVDLAFDRPFFFHECGAVAVTRLAFRSRAPPVVL